MRRVIGIAELCRILGRSRSSVSRYLANPSLSFPRPVRLGPRNRAWYSDEVEAWVEACPLGDERTATAGGEEVAAPRRQTRKGPGT